MNIKSLTESKQKGKKYTIKFSNPTKTIHFGSEGSSTYLDNKDKTTRDNYMNRHAPNEDWDDPLSAGALSLYILWGPFTDINDNLDFYKKTFNIN
jgi:hypothetical protein